MNDTPETDKEHEIAKSCGFPLMVQADFARKMERERNSAIRVLRILKSDIDHMGHWLPAPCRKMVESFLTENAKEHPTT